MLTLTRSLQMRAILTLGMILIWTVTACSNDNKPAHRGTDSSGGMNNGANNGTAKVPSNNIPATPYPTVNPVPTVPPATNDCYKASDFVCKVEHLITNKTNAYRATVGKGPLTYDAQMAFVARDWSAKQGASGSISHSGFPEARSAVYMQEFKISADFSAENVAMSGYGSGGTTDADAESVADDFATMWWNSSGHRENMVGDYSKLGMGMAQDSSGSWYGTQIFQ